MEQLFGAHFIVYVILRSDVYIRLVHSAAQFIVLLCSAVYVRPVHSAACAGCVGLVPSLSLSLSTGLCSIANGSYYNYSMFNVQVSQLTSKLNLFGFNNNVAQQWLHESLYYAPGQTQPSDRTAKILLSRASSSKYYGFTRYKFLFFLVYASGSLFFYE